MLYAGEHGIPFGSLRYNLLKDVIGTCGKRLNGSSGRGGKALKDQICP